MILEATNIKKIYQISKVSSLAVLKGVSLSIAEAEVSAIVGPSGAGKSTLVHILGLLDKPTEGEIQFDGKNVTALSDEELSGAPGPGIGSPFSHSMNWRMRAS